jgi:uncharacterized protein YkwD
MKSMKKTLKKYFVPHQENDHKPHILRERAVLGIATLAAVLFLASVAGNYAVKHIPSLASIQSAFLVDLANEDRADLGLKELAINDKLVTAANLKASDMADKSYFAHVSPEGKTPWYWIGQAGYAYIYAGENLAVNFDESKDVENAWMNSPTHKANIVNNKYTEIGIATAEGMYKGEKTIFVVQMFGSPKKSVVLQGIEDTLAPKVAEASEIVPVVKPKPSNPPTSSDGQVTEAVVTPAPKPQTVVLGADTDIEQPEVFMSFVNPEATPEELNQTEVANENQHVAYTNWFERALVSPSSVISHIYIVLAALIVFSLILKIFIEIRLQHPRNIAYGVILLVIVLAFMYFNGQIAPEPTLVMG